LVAEIFEKMSEMIFSFLLVNSNWAIDFS